MLIGTFNKEAFDTKMCKDGECRLRMSKGISRYGSSREITKLFLQEVQT